MENQKKRGAVALHQNDVSSLKERVILFAKGGFLLLSAILALQIFMKVVYFTNL